MPDQMQDDLRLAGEILRIVREQQHYEIADEREHANMKRAEGLLERLADSADMPQQFRVVTITAPDGAGFDVWIRNLYEPHMAISALIEAAGGSWEGYSTDADAPPERTPNGFDPRWVEAINGVLADRETGVTVSDLTDSLWDKHIGPLVDAIENAAAHAGGEFTPDKEQS